MKLRTIHLMGMVLAAAATLATLAPAASASGDYGSGGGDRCEGRRSHAARYDGWEGGGGAGYNGSRYGDQSCAGNSGRSYFYREVATGRSNDYISALRPRWGCRGTSPVEMIDKRSGRLLNTYIWSGTRWDKCGREGYARSGGRGHGHDRYAYDDDDDGY